MAWTNPSLNNPSDTSLLGTTTASIKANAALDSYVANFSGPADAKMPIFSGVANANSHGNLATIAENEKLSIFSMTYANATTATGDNKCVVTSIQFSGSEDQKTHTALTMSGKAQGPYFISLELPIEITGPADVWGLQIINTPGGSATETRNNYCTIHYQITPADKLT